MPLVVEMDVPQPWAWSVEQFERDCADLGIVGEVDLALAVYVVGTSRVQTDPLSAIVHGPSGSGKSVIVAKVAQLFPEDHKLDATRMTAQALYHLQTPIAHRFVVAGERSRIQDDAVADATAALRQLQSEKKITKQIAERDGNGFVTREVRVVGPIAYIETTTVDPSRIFPEDLNRALLLTTDEGERQTREILRRHASRYSAGGQPPNTERIIDRHRQFQMAVVACDITIPFAGRLMEAIPARKVEARRIGQQVLSVIEAVALLHHQRRERDDRGRLIATRADYEIAKRMLAKPLTASTSLGVGEAATALYDTLVAREFPDGQFTTPQAQMLHMISSEKSIRNWLNELADYGCVRLVRKSVGPNPATWKINGKKPSDTLLPDAASLG
jgi:hypothetical protein